MNPLFALVATLTAAAAVQAQTPSRALALTRNVPFLATVDPSNCNLGVCNPALPPAPAPYAGGTAHDPRDRATWISNGIQLMKVDPRNSCNVICPPVTAPGLTASSLVTGLAVNEETQRLFISYSDNRIATYSAIGCTLTFVSQCTPALPPNHIIAGLATEDATNTLYFGASPWGGVSSTPWAEVHVTSQNSPCTPACRFSIPGCTGTLLVDLTGLGFDACRRELYVTDGDWILTLTNTWTCTPTSIACCPPIASLGDPMSGLCVLPSTEVSVGAPCFGGTSPVCPNMLHRLGGDPTIGNWGFSLDLADAPAGNLAFALIDIGPCATTGFGNLCQPLLPTTLLGVAITTGTGCNGFASVALPIPNIPILCGAVLSSQYAGQVPPGWSGNFVSNCLSWMITAS